MYIMYSGTFSSQQHKVKPLVSYIKSNEMMCLAVRFKLLVILLSCPTTLCNVNHVILIIIQSTLVIKVDGGMAVQLFAVFHMLFNKGQVLTPKDYESGGIWDHFKWNRKERHNKRYCIHSSHLHFILSHLLSFAVSKFKTSLIGIWS